VIGSGACKDPPELVVTIRTQRTAEIHANGMRSRRVRHAGRDQLNVPAPRQYARPVSRKACSANTTASRNPRGPCSPRRGSRSALNPEVIEAGVADPHVLVERPVPPRAGRRDGPRP
jgi:hypothetical protein